MSEEPVPNNDDKEAKKIAGRKKRVITGYRAATLAYLASPIMLLVKYRSIAWSQVYVLAGPVLASGVAHVLTDAAVKDRLQSDTYKRLNLSLGAYAALTLSMVPLAPDTFANPFFLVPALLGLINCSKGYAYGVLGWDKKTGSFKEDLFLGVKSTIQKLVLTFPNNLASLGYLGATLTLGGMKLAKLADLGSLMQLESTTSFLIATRFSRIAKLSLLTAVLFTLKDAADQDLLGGTTFIELNFLSSFILGTLAGRLNVFRLQELFSCGNFISIISNTMLLLLLWFLHLAYLSPGGAVTKLGGAISFFALFTAFNGVVGLVLKKK